MYDFPPELNKSKFNPSPEETKNEETKKEGEE